MRELVAVAALAGIAWLVLSKKGQVIMTSTGKTVVSAGSAAAGAISDAGSAVASAVASAVKAISERGIALIKSLEGFASSPYPDAGGHSVGYGHFIPPGKPLFTVTPAQAENLLRSDVSAAESAISRYVKVPLTQGQHDALVSFIFNIGSGAFSTSTLLRKLNAGDYAGAAEQFAVWNKTHTPGGQLVVSQSLVNRRAVEKQTFLS